MIYVYESLSVVSSVFLFKIGIQFVLTAQRFLIAFPFHKSSSPCSDHKLILEEEVCPLKQRALRVEISCHHDRTRRFEQKH